MNNSLDNSLVSNGQLNNSSSKMKYSFPKSSRFENNRYTYGLKYVEPILLLNIMIYPALNRKGQLLLDMEIKQI